MILLSVDRYRHHRCSSPAIFQPKSNKTRLIFGTSAYQFPSRTDCNLTDNKKTLDSVFDYRVYDQFIGIRPDAKL